MSIHLGIDFGTTNSVVAQLVEEPARAAVRVLRSELGEERTPSAVAVTRDGRWLFGQPAREADARDKLLSVKRLLGSGEAVPLGGLSLQPEAVAALLFRHLVLTAQKSLDEPVQSAVVTVPANSKGLQRSATKVAAAAAGLRVLNLINEPTAAAMAYGLGRAGQELRVLVYDFGGGTFDVTILRAHHGIFEELASRGLRRCGGDDLDAALAEQLRGDALAGASGLDEPYPALRLRLACEAAKIELSRAETSRVDVEDLLPGVSLHETVTREALEGLAFPIIERTAEPVREALAAARLLPSDLDHILLVGGSSRMPLVREFVENLLGQAAEPFDQADPMTCVAQGAAIVAGILGGAKHLADLDYQVCLEHSLCTEPVDPMTGRRYLEPVIEHGTKIPNRNSKVYFPVADYSAEVTVRIVEGNVYDDPTSEENAPLGRVRVPLEPPRPSDDCPIEVQFEYSEDGLLTAVARDLRQDRTFSQVIDYRSGHLSDPEQADLAALLAEVFGAPAPEVTPTTGTPAALATADGAPELREARRRLAQADQVLAQVPGDETNLLRELREELDQALSAGDAAAVTEVDGRLAAELMFFDYLL